MPLVLLACVSSCTSLSDLTAPSCVFVLSSASAAFDSRGGKGSEQVSQGAQHAPYFAPSPMDRVITSFMISLVPP